MTCSLWLELYLRLYICILTSDNMLYHVPKDASHNDSSNHYESSMDAYVSDYPVVSNQHSKKLIFLARKGNIYTKTFKGTIGYGL